MENKCNECCEEFNEPVIVDEDTVDEIYVCPHCYSPNWDTNNDE